MTLAALLLPDDVKDRRKGPRYRVQLELVPIDLGPEVVRVAIREVSATGLLLQTEKVLQPKAKLIIELPNSERKTAEIVWGDQRFYGAKFAVPLTPDELQKLRETSTVSWPELSDSEQVEVHKMFVRIQKAFGADNAAIAKAEKLPLPQRLQIIFGSTALLWILILGCVWLAVG